MLARCPNCSATITTRSLRCSDCHGPLNRPGKDAAGMVFGWAFGIFNMLMLAWLGFYMLTGRVTIRAPRIEGADNMAQAPVGGEMGIGFVLLLWGLGAIILGICAVFSAAHNSARKPSPHRALR